MNKFQRLLPGLVLCYMCSLLLTSPICLSAKEEAPLASTDRAAIPNHHIFYRNDKRAPLTKIEIVFLGAGRNQEQPSQNGLAVTVSKLIWEAAKKHGYIDQLAMLGTELDIFADTTSLTISIYALSKNCSKSIKIVHTLIDNLAFSESDLKEVKKREANNYQNYLQGNLSMLMTNFALSQTIKIKKLRSLKTLKNLSLENIKQYYDRLLKTEVVFFKVTSDLDSTEVAKLLHPITTEFQTGGGFVHSLEHSATDHNSGPSAFVFKNYSHLKNVFCHWLIPCGSIYGEDYIPAMISSTLGDDDQGLLHRYFREELGLVYGSACEVEIAEGILFLNIYADPQIHNSEELIIKMFNFIRKLPDNSNFWKVLKSLRENRNITSDYEWLTPQRRLDSEVYSAIYNPPTRKGGYDSVTDAEVRAFLEKFFVPENMIMIFVGPRDHIIDILNKHLPEADIRVHDVKELIE